MLLEEMTRPPQEKSLFNKGMSEIKVFSEPQ